MKGREERRRKEGRKVQSFYLRRTRVGWAVRQVNGGLNREEDEQ